MKKKILNILDNDHLEKFFVFLILLELVVCLIDSSTPTGQAFKLFFRWFEIFVMAIFTTEYVLRLFTTDKFKNVFKPLMMIDLLTILPVTGLIFILSLAFSSGFICLAEQSTAHLAIKELRASSWWSVITFAIYCYDGSLPIATVSKFMTSVSPNLSLFFEGIALFIIMAAVLDTIIKKYHSINLKKSTIRQEPTFVDF